jgi:hypothetical protein
MQAGATHDAAKRKVTQEQGEEGRGGNMGEGRTNP